ncbi:hypothetical protein ES703_60925 [subsurface metagenome]
MMITSIQSFLIWYMVMEPLFLPFSLQIQQEIDQFLSSIKNIQFSFHLKYITHPYCTKIIIPYIKYMTARPTLFSLFHWIIPIHLLFIPILCLSTRTLLTLLVKLKRLLVDVHTSVHMNRLVLRLILIVIATPLIRIQAQ